MQLPGSSRKNARNRPKVLRSAFPVSDCGFLKIEESKSRSPGLWADPIHTDGGGKATAVIDVLRRGLRGRLAQMVFSYWAHVPVTRDRWRTRFVPVGTGGSLTPSNSARACRPPTAARPMLILHF